MYSSVSVLGFIYTRKRQTNTDTHTNFLLSLPYFSTFTSLYIVSCELFGNEEISLHFSSLDAAQLGSLWKTHVGHGLSIFDSYWSSVELPEALTLLSSQDSPSYVHVDTCLVLEPHSIDWIIRCLTVYEWQASLLCSPVYISHPDVQWVWLCEWVWLCAC